MAQGYRPLERARQLPVAASLTNEPISFEFPVTAGGARMFSVAVVATAVTGTVDINLQTAMYGQEWITVKSTTIAAPGTAYINLLDTRAADQAALPLYDKCRVTVTTGVGEAITVSSVLELQER